MTEIYKDIMLAVGGIVWSIVIFLLYVLSRLKLTTEDTEDTKHKEN